VPQRELDAFNAHIERARDLVGITNAIRANSAGVLDLSDIYRAAFVQGVSALDTFIHAEVRARMLEAFAWQSGHTPAFGRFRVSLGSLGDARGPSGLTASDLTWLDSEIREQHSYLSFQQPDKVADAIRLVSPVKLWSAVASEMGVRAVGESPEQVVKRRLALIVDRRNTIVHESDLDPTPPGTTQYPMDEATALDALEFLQNMTASIVSVIDEGSARQ
jgi:hypothetical protein